MPKAHKKRKKNKKKSTKGGKTVAESRPAPPTNTPFSDKVSSVKPGSSENPNTTINASEMEAYIESQESEILSTEEDQQSEDGYQEEKKPAILVIKPSAPSKGQGFQSRAPKKESIVLSKKQRQNLRKKEIEKSIKNENEMLQKQRLEKYRKEQEREALKKLMKR